MSKKKELLNRYVDIHFRKIKDFFPMIIEEFDINKIKTDIDESNKITVEKNKIDDVFKTKIAEYLNLKFEIIKNNVTFIHNRYEMFGFDYDLADQLLYINSYKYAPGGYDYAELRDDISIEDCKNIVLDFYRDLFKDRSNDIHYIEYLMKNKTNIVFDYSRGITNAKTRDMNISYSNDIKFLLVLVHELAHAYALRDFKGNLHSTDIRNIEMESSIVEHLLLKYLKDKKLAIIKDEDGIRPVNDEDIETHFLCEYNIITTAAMRILDEVDFILSFDELDVINKDFLDVFQSNSAYDYNYIDQAAFINEILNHYIDSSLVTLNMKSLNEELKNVSLYTTSDLDSFEGTIRYFISKIVALHFRNIYDEKEKEKFIEFFSKKNYYNVEDFIYLFGLEINDLSAVAISIAKKYEEIAEKKNLEYEPNPLVPKNFMKEVTIYYKHLLENKDDYDPARQQQIILERQLFSMFNQYEVSSDIYPFDIRYQFDDSDVEKFESIKNKLLNLRN